MCVSVKGESSNEKGEAGQPGPPGYPGQVVRTGAGHTHLKRNTDKQILDVSVGIDVLSYASLNLARSGSTW